MTNSLARVHVLDGQAAEYDFNKELLRSRQNYQDPKMFIFIYVKLRDWLRAGKILGSIFWFVQAGVESRTRQKLIMMTRVHSTVSPDDSLASSSGCMKPDTLTVWKKSLLLNFSGFTVFDSRGELVFRVDNYGNDCRDEILLMDAAGKPLLTMRKKKLSLGDQWQVFEGEPKETGGSPKPIYCVKKQTNILKKPKILAHIFDGSCKSFLFVVHGSYAKRSCQVIDASGRVVAEIRTKETVCGINYTDVFRLIVQPDFDAASAMATVLLLDRMFSSRWSPIF